MDHRLRPESSDEAEAVARAARSLPGVHDVAVTRLNWHRGTDATTSASGADDAGIASSGTTDETNKKTLATPTPHGGIQAVARNMRYAALGQWASANGGGVILTAHHIDDQVETVLMRVGMCSGLIGIGGIRRRVTLNVSCLCACLCLNVSCVCACLSPTQRPTASIPP